MVDPGLPLPKVGYHFPGRPPAWPPPAKPDLGSVANSMNNAVQAGSAGLDRWAKDIKQIKWPADQPPNNPIKVSMGGRTDATPGYFKKVDITIDKIGEGLVEGKPGQVLSGLGEYFTKPGQTTAVGVYGQRINAWQQLFRKEHGLNLSAMNRTMWKISTECNEMRKLALDPPQMNPRIAEIMKEKETKGDELMQKVQDRLRASEPGEERDKLEDLWKRMSGWQRARDKRLDADRTQVYDMNSRMDHLNQEAKKIAMGLRDGERESGLMVRSDTLHHADPQAAIFAEGLRQYLMGTKQTLDSALTNK
ncbi:MAG TPA: hypothetical protein VG329_04345 [Candidatus Dormibacteraeota bacterium]|jgi:hypothetical protein|nr:hypothetical protein [Candidatus Dormibacteraeota bacterium]